MKAQEYFLKLNEQQVISAFKGKIGPAVLRSILRTTESKLVEQGESVPVRKKIFNILVELIQNLIKHVDTEARGDKAVSTLMVTRDEEGYLISTGNPLHKSMSAEMQDRIQRLNAMSKEELRQFYMNTMVRNELSEKGGAGLGLIDIVRKAGGKINCFVDQVNDYLDFLVLQIRVKTPSNFESHRPFVSLDMKYTVHNLSIESTEDSPRVLLDAVTGLLSFSGTSIPENSEEFYSPILDWLSDYVESQPEKVEVSFKLEYFNTSSSKYILEIFRQLEKLDQSCSVLVKWCYLKEDEDMKEAGEDFQLIVKLPFEFLEYEE
jgi:hypothetical protein